MSDRFSLSIAPQVTKMPDLSFDLDKTYEENIRLFEEHITKLNPAMAEILLRHLDTLLAGEDPGGRANRSAFNRSVLADLEAAPLPFDEAS